MRPRRHADPAAWLLVTTVALAAGVAAQSGAPAISGRTYAIVAAEDARATTPEQLQTLIAATRDSSPDVQAVAVRALGRLERADLIDAIAAKLSSSDAPVRTEAANALAQTVTNLADDPDAQIPRVETALKGALEFESDPQVRSAVLQSLGRLPLKTPADRTRIERELARHLEVQSSSEQSAAMVLAALRGLEALYRAWPRPFTPDAGVLAAVDRAFVAFSTGAAYMRPVRRMVLAASIAANHASADVIRAAILDLDDQVRRLAVLSAALPNAPVDLRALISGAITDRSPMVRFEALRIYGRQFQAGDCAPLTKAVVGPYPKTVNGELMPEARSVVLLALDLLGDPCPDNQPATDLLAREAAGGDWRRAAHAYVALARRAPDRARPMLPQMLAHGVWQVRMYAARAAAVLGDADALLKLANDNNDNVREAAVGGLVQGRGHAADDVYIAALSRRDYQLVRTAARALQGTPKRKPASDALVAAFDRVSAEHRDTSRDTRVALVQRLRETGSPEHAKQMEPCLADFDPRVATECGLMLLEWGARKGPLTAPAAARPVTPAAAEIAALVGAHARIKMANGRTIELALLTSEAPLSVARFARLARAGYYDGLTFHRVVPNFVIQGGSPGANEYAGDGPFMRDEVGLRSHGRGTVGVSTRGRDTGDAQIFINLVDNTRLDHIYTVFAEVVSGMDVVEDVEEGDVMEKVEIVK